MKDVDDESEIVMDPLTKIIADVIADHTVSFFGAYLPIPEDAAGMLAEGIVEAIHADRTITTDEELDALPDGAVVLDADGDVMEADTNSDRRIWYVPGREWERVGNDYTHLPARVLYRPDEDGQ